MVELPFNPQYKTAGHERRRRGLGQLVTRSVPKALDEAFARRLREALARRGVRKLYPLALEIGVDESAVSRWRQGQAMSLENAVRLAVHLDISLDWLLTGRGSLEAHRPPTPDRVDPSDVHGLTERLERLPPAAVPLLLALLDMLAPAPAPGG